MNKNQSNTYPSTDIPWQIKKAFFLPVFLDTQATIGITIKVVAKAPTQPKSVGQIPASEALPLKR